MHQTVFNPHRSAHREIQHGPVETYELGKFAQRVDVQLGKCLHPRSSDSHYTSHAPGEARRLSQTVINRATTISLPSTLEKENLSFIGPFCEHDAINSRFVQLAGTSADLKCVAKWIDIPDSTLDLTITSHVH